MTDIDNINKAVELFFAENPDVSIAKPKDLMPICIRIGMFNKDHRAGLPLRKILRELDKAGKLHLIPSLEAERKEKNTYWSFIRK
ncbi:hypothetical protein [Dysgonomonas mossii]|uniref:hypothetical protein n=1 Tax=Dysgonomonas mossii TaxID=163665 RepID=UPI0039919D8A